MPWVVPDFETASQCDLKKSGAWRYAEDPTTEVLCLAWEYDDGFHEIWYPGDPVPPRFLAAMTDPSFIFIAHNASFEKAIWRRIMVPAFGWPDIPNSRWHDTQAICAMRAVPQALEKALKVMRLPVEKDMEGNRLTLSMSRVNKKTGMLPAVTPFVQLRIGQYCEIDVRGQAALHRRMGWMPETERNVWLLDQRINERGLRLDMPFVRAAKEIVRIASEPLADEFKQITGYGINQNVKVRDWVVGEGVNLPNMTKDTLARILGGDENGEVPDDDFGEELEDIVLPKHVRRALEIRQLIGSASIKKLDSMEACVCADGRAHGLLQYHGAGPGRWAGRLLQPHNFPRGTNDLISIPVEDKVAAIMTGDPDFIRLNLGQQPVETVVASLRHAMTCERGRVLVAGDYAGIEARVVLALAGQHDKTALLASGADVYCDMAGQIFGRVITKKDTAERQTGKNSVLGLGFQMGGPKFFSRYAQDQDLEFAQKVVDTYRKVWAPKVPKLWGELGNASLEAMRTGRPHEAYGVLYALEDEWMTARLPSGRKLWYHGPRMNRKLMPWSTADEPDVRLIWQYNAQKLGHWRTIDAFGGLMTENVVQGLARDLLVEAMFKCEREGLPVVLTVHDEIVAEPLASRQDAEKVLDEVMGDVPDWCRHMQVPVSTETWVGERYKK